MYIRPKLSRHKSTDMNILFQEHKKEIESLDEKLDVGKKYEDLLTSINERIIKLQDNERIPHEEKRLLIDCLSDLVEELEKEYNDRIKNDLKTGKISMTDRIEEMSEAIKIIDNEIYFIENEEFSATSIDKSHILGKMNEIRENYSIQKSSSVDMSSKIIKRFEEQQNNIDRMRKEIRSKYR